MLNCTQHFMVMTNSICKILLAKCTRSSIVVLSHQNYRRILRILRGYRYLKASHGLGRIIPLHRALTITKIGGCKDVYSKLIFGASTNTAELAIRQWRKMRAGTAPPFNSALYYSQGRTRGLVAHYIPTVWQAIIREHGFPVSGVKSNLMWYGHVFIHMCAGILNFVKILVGSASQIYPKIGLFHGRYVYFDDLPDSKIPHYRTVSQSFDIFSWYLNWPESVPNLTVLVHGRHKLSSCTRNDTPIIGTRWPVPLFTEPRAPIQFFWHGDLRPSLYRFWTSSVGGGGMLRCSVTPQRPHLYASNHQISSTVSTCSTNHGFGIEHFTPTKRSNADQKLPSTFTP